MLFDDLPAPKGHEQAGRRPQETVDEPPEKRQRVELDHAGASGDAQAEQRQQQQQHDDTEAPGPSAPPPPPAAEVGPALLKIANHISNPAKFVKASGLLRQLITSGVLSCVHRAELFAAMRAAFSNPDRANDPALRRDYRRLVNAFCNGVPPDVLAPAQGAHLEVYQIWTLQRGELSTDDNFAFNKAVSRLKEDIASLGPVSPAEEAAALGLELPSGKKIPRPAAAAAAAAGQQEAEGDEADPFGLDELIRRNEEEERRQRQELEAAARGEQQGQGGEEEGPWTAVELSVMRRQALLDCVTAAKALHKLAWARTSVEMLIEAAHGHISHFVSPQRAVLEDYMRWVKSERAARRSEAARGAGAGKEMTSFEKARAEWANAAVSRYGKVGSAGDAKSSHWLG